MVSDQVKDLPTCFWAITVASILLKMLQGRSVHFSLLFNSTVEMSGCLNKIDVVTITKIIFYTTWDFNSLEIADFNNGCIVFSLSYVKSAHRENFQRILFSKTWLFPSLLQNQLSWYVFTAGTEALFAIEITICLNKGCSILADGRFLKPYQKCSHVDTLPPINWTVLSSPLFSNKRR